MFAATVATVAAALVLSPSLAFAAGRYWVGGTGNWSDTAHWSETSGGASGVSLPTGSDHVHFDANSGAGIATVNATAYCLDLDFT